MANPRAPRNTPPSDAATDRAPARGARVPHVVLLVVIASVFALCGAFLWVYLTVPSDGTRVDPGERSWQRDGVVVAPLEVQPGSLRAGDLVVAIDGRGLGSWAAALFQPGAAPPRLSSGERVIYTVVRGGKRLDIPVHLGAYPLGALLSQNWGLLGFDVVFEVVGLFVYLRRPREAAAAVLLLSASSLLGSSAWLFGLQAVTLTGGPAFWLYSISVMAVYLLFWSSLLHFSLVFPRPNTVARTRPWLIPLIYALPFAVYLVYLGVGRALTPTTLAWLGLWEPGEVGIGTLYVALAVVIVALTYQRHPDPAIRRKIRWVAFGTALSGGGAVVLWFIPWYVLGHRIISINLLGLLLLPFPLALAIAILRHRLFDIDVIINRALVYGTLTAALALVYFVCVVALHALIDGVSGQTSTAAIVASTLASAILFEPLRHRIQIFIDRRFYRAKYDAVRTLAAFAAALHDELDLAQLSQRLVAIVDETMQPESVSVWLRPSDPPSARHEHLAEPLARSSAPPLPTDSLAPSTLAARSNEDTASVSHTVLPAVRDHGEAL